MNDSANMTRPIFKFSLSNFNDPNYGYIRIGAEKIHRVADVDKFHKALGYTTEANRSGILPDEFIWSEYHRPGGTKSQICLQARIIEYLSDHSPEFVENHSEHLAKLIGSCSENRIANTAGCGGCLLHPNKTKDGHD
jgi:hypothetical protein